MIVPPEVEPLREAIARVLADAELRARLGAGGREVARARLVGVGRAEQDRALPAGDRVGRAPVIDLAVLGPDPRFGGGGAALVEAFLEGARALGRSPELLFAPHPTFDGRRWTLDRVEAIRQLRSGLRHAASAKEATSLWVAAPLATHGLAAPPADRAYGCWLATTLDDEWAARARGLDRGRRLAQGMNALVLRRLERRLIREAARVYAISPASRAAIAAAGGA